MKEQSAINKMISRDYPGLRDKIWEIAPSLKNTWTCIGGKLRTKPIVEIIYDDPKLEAIKRNWYLVGIANAVIHEFFLSRPEFECSDFVEDGVVDMLKEALEHFIPVGEKSHPINYDSMREYNERING